MKKQKGTAIKEVMGYSSAYPNICNLKLLPNINGGWITIQDDVGTSMTIKLSDLGDFICCDAIDAIKTEIIEEYKLESENLYGNGMNRCLEIIEKHTSGGAK